MEAKRLLEKRWCDTGSADPPRGRPAQWHLRHAGMDHSGTGNAAALRRGLPVGRRAGI